MFHKQINFYDKGKQKQGNAIDAAMCVARIPSFGKRWIFWMAPDNDLHLLAGRDHIYWQDKDKKKADKKFRKQKQKIEETIKYADAEEVAEMIAGFVWKESETE